MSITYLTWKKNLFICFQKKKILNNKLMKASDYCGIKFSTAQKIFKIFKKEQRIGKKQTIN